MVDTLLQDFVSLLYGGLEEADAQLALAQAAPTLPQPSDPLGVPEWAAPGVVNFRGKVCTTGDQYVAPV